MSVYRSIVKKPATPLPAPVPPLSKWYRRGGRKYLTERIAKASQVQTQVDEMRGAMVLERATKKPRRWLLSLLEARSAVLEARIKALEPIGRPGFSQVLTPVEVKPYLNAAEKINLLAADLLSARAISATEAAQWLADQPADARLRVYSVAGYLLYFGREIDR